jgi:cytochrome P450
MKSPAAYKKLVDEIDEATVDGSLSQPSVRYSEAAKLPYLSACIKEGMRVHPSVGFTLPRYVPEYGCEIAGKWFRGGSRVGVNAAVVHFDRNIFGDDADMFNPDRWFRPGVENLDKHMFQVSK